jgi:hypothetical protein
MVRSGASNLRPPIECRRAGLVGGLLALLVFATIACGGAPSGLLARGPYTSDFFDAQAEALLDGRLDVDPVMAGIEGFEHDGRTYLYFGLFPSILRLPTAALTDSLQGRLGVVSMVAALAVALWASGRLLWRARLWRHPDDPPLRSWEPAAFGLFVAAVGLASPLVFLAARPVVYHEAELWGVATTLVALERLLHWWEAPSSSRLAIASLAATVAFNTRASSGGGAVVALALVLALAVLWHLVPARAIPSLALAILVPVATYATVNVSRFDTPFSVPFDEQGFTAINANRRAVLEATDGTLFGPEYAPSALATYLRPDGIALQRLFPWITFRETDTIIGDPVFEATDRSASLPTVAPGFLVLALAGVGALVRRRARDPWLAATVGAATGLVSTVTIAFIAHRYLADFMPVLILPATVGAWTLGHLLDGTSARPRRAAIITLGIVTAGSFVISVLLALQAQRLFLFPGQEPRRGFVALQQDIDAALTGGRPPGVSHSDALPQDADAGNRGRLHITGACQALYWSDGEVWHPLELGGDLAFQLRGPIAPGTTDLLTTDDWRLELRRTGDELVASYRGPGGPTRGDPATVDDDDHRILVMLDPVRHVLITEVDGVEVLRTFAPSLDSTVEPGSAWEVQQNPTPLCDRLLDRITDDAVGQRIESTEPRAGSSS